VNIIRVQGRETFLDGFVKSTSPRGRYSASWIAFCSNTVFILIGDGRQAQIRVRGGRCGQNGN
jgi:hypothetical protein